MTAENTWYDLSQKPTSVGFLTARIDKVEQGNHKLS